MNAWILAVWMVLEASGLRVQPQPVAQVVAQAQVRAIVSMAAVREDVPPALLNGIHGAECARKPICEVGDGGDALGPFQIHRETALWADCDYPRVIHLEPAAACAARILAMKRQLCRTWGEALGHYNSGRCKDARYAAKVRRWM